MNSDSSNRLPEILGVVLVLLVGAIIWTKAGTPPAPQVVHNVSPGLPAAPQYRPSDWKPANPALRRQAARAIVSQLEAFKRDDYEGAVKFQSSSLRRNFKSVTAFRRMMQMTYPQFASYKSIHFDKAVATTDGQRLQIAVRLRGRDGVDTRAMYEMVRENGNFRVDGVTGGMAAPGEVQAV